MGNGKNIEKRNFGLSSNSEKDYSVFDNWFWESKEKKKMKKEQHQADIERMRAETAAMKQILTEQDDTPPTGINVGKIALIGGGIILLSIGAVVLLKRKKTGTEAAPKENLTAEDLIV